MKVYKVTMSFTKNTLEKEVVTYEIEAGNKSLAFTRAYHKLKENPDFGKDSYIELVDIELVKK